MCNRRPWIRMLFWALFWTAVGLFFSTQTYLALGGQEGAWARALRNALPQWYLWGALSPLIVAADRGLIGAGAPLARRIALHVPLGFAWCTVYILLRRLADLALDAPSVTWAIASLATQYHWNILIYTVIVGAYVAYDYHREAQHRALRASRLEARFAEARLDALKAQLRPHFLFNTLNAITAFMERDPKTARRMTAHLGDLLRHSLERGEAQEIPLADELALLEDYVAIQRIRFEGRLAFQADVAPDALGVRVPSLVLQPLVENAIQHGLRDRTVGGRIVLSAHRRGDALALTVSDNGAGLPAGWEANGLGVGLRNTVERLERLYGARARLDIRNGTGGGVTVELVIPWRADG